MERVEVGSTIDAKQQGFAVQHKAANAKRRLDHPRVTIGPIVIVARE